MTKRASVQFDVSEEDDQDLGDLVGEFKREPVILWQMKPMSQK